MPQATLILCCDDGDHATEINPALATAFHPAWQSPWLEFTCGTCRKAFRVAFHMGGPFYWDETTDHPEPNKGMRLLGTHGIPPDLNLD